MNGNNAASNNKRIFVGFTRINKRHRHYLIKNADYFVHGGIVAGTIEIQRVMRGFLTRRKLQGGETVYEKEKREKEFYMNRMINAKYEEIGRGIKESERTRTDFLLVNQELIQARVWALLERAARLNRINYALYPMYHTAAIVIQRSFRARRKKLIRKYGKGIFMQNGRMRFFDPVQDSVVIIQRAWKKFLNREIFKFYKEMIQFRERLDPVFVLKGINPGEAYMIDPASAIHIRFRLGGTTFPPTLFYKIFTHNPVCDIGAFAPRDYTVVKRVLDSKKRNASTGSLASSASFEADPDDKSRWYRREDNNGWRPISDKLIGDLDFDHENYTTPAVVRSAVSRETKREQQTNEVFHFSSIQRAKEKKANRKKRKVEWLKKMYRMNLMREKSTLEDKQVHAKQRDITSGAITEKSKDNQRRLEERRVEIDKELEGLDKFDEEELAEIVQWSDSLDFEQYVDHWNGLAITLPSDYKQMLRNAPPNLIKRTSPALDDKVSNIDSEQLSVKQ